MASEALPAAACAPAVNGSTWSVRPGKSSISRTRWLICPAITPGPPTAWCSAASPRITDTRRSADAPRMTWRRVALAATASDGRQRGLLAVRHPVLGQQLAQFLGPDATLAGLDPADLRPVALQHASRVLQRVSHVLPVPAQRASDEAAPHGGFSGHGSCLSAA